MKFRLRARRGVTLPELIVASTATLLVVTALVSLSVVGGQSWSATGSQVMADEAASIALQRWANDVSAGRSAQVVNGELQVTVPGTNTSGDYDASAASTTIRYYLQGHKLYRQVGTATARALAEDIVAISFSVTPPTVALNLTARHRVANTYKQTTMFTQAALRNYEQ